MYRLVKLYIKRGYATFKIGQGTDVIFTPKNLWTAQVIRGTLYPYDKNYIKEIVK